MVGAKRIERLGHQIWTDEPASGSHDDGYVRNIEALSRDRRPEVNFVAHDDIGPPLACDANKPHCAFAANPPGEALPDHLLFCGSIDWHQWSSGGRFCERAPATSNSREASRPDRAEHRFLSAEGHLVAPSGHRASNRQGR